VTHDTVPAPTREPGPAAVDDGDVDDAVADFLQVRPQLFGIAYRMLGSVAEAEDVVQDAWIRWQNTDRRGVQNSAAFLTTTTTRLAINAVTSARARRETYIGPWLPEPVDTSADPTLGAERAEALDGAILLLMERLTPTERAAYVLREAFDYSYREVADVLGVSEANARQLVRRARTALASERRHGADPARQRQLVEAFVAAARSGSVAELERLFADDVHAHSDGGGKVFAARVEIRGCDRVVNYLDNVLRKYWRDAEFVAVDVNGEAGMLVRQTDGVPLALVMAQTGPAAIQQILCMLNPDKLQGFAPA
jgi:RNA polymerase sigma-70 factor (TIGR02957 family)